MFIIPFAWQLLKQINLKYAIPIGAFIIIVGICYFKGYSDAANKCKSAEITAQLKELQAEIAKVADAKKDADIRASSLEINNHELTNRVNNYASELSKRLNKNGGCSLDDYDVRQLRKFPAL